MPRRRREGHWITTDAETSERLARVRQKGTKPELIVRRTLWALGARYRIGNRDLPGSPDVANRARGWAVFVHGCFWHRHQGCKATTTPKRNRAFWEAKFTRNVERDRRAIHQLHERGFRVLVVWECEAREPHATLRERLADLVYGSQSSSSGSA